MPSKGGRPSNQNHAAPPSVVSGPPVAPRTREEWDAAGFTTGAIAQPLRRGVDVGRFNELAAREDELPPAEADELYAFRLRRAMSRLLQLARARTRGDEEGIRSSLDDLDERLRELGELEDARRQAGLPAEYPLDLGERQAAIDQLLEMARRRPPGLVAGDGIPPQAAGEVRLPAIAFRPTDGDAPVYILAPRSLPSDSLAANAEAVANQGANLHLVHDPSEIRRDSQMPPLVLNWGGSDALPADLIVLNRTEAVRIASDQVESVRRLGELAPRTVLRPDDMHLLGTDRVVAKRRHGSRGSGKGVIDADAAWADRCRYDLYQELLPRQREYRVSVLNGRVVSAYLKRAPEGTSPDDLRPAWTHERVDVLPRAVVTAAREASRRIGLDYSGVDVIEGSDAGIRCLEVNTAPGMSEQTLRNLYAQLQQALRGRLPRAA